MRKGETIAICLHGETTTPLQTCADSRLGDRHVQSLEEYEEDGNDIGVRGSLVYANNGQKFLEERE